MRRRRAPRLVAFLLVGLLVGPSILAAFHDHAREEVRDCPVCEAICIVGAPPEPGPEPIHLVPVGACDEVLPVDVAPSAPPASPPIRAPPRVVA